LEEGIQEVYDKNMRKVVAKIRKASFVSSSVEYRF